MEITGRTPSEGLGTYWTDAVHPDDREEVTRQWREAVRDQCGFRTEYRYRHLDGRVVPVAVKTKTRSKTTNKTAAGDAETGKAN